MQRIISLAKTVTTWGTCLPQRSAVFRLRSYFSTLQKDTPTNKFLQVDTPLLNQICTFKVKGVVKRRCKDCYLVVREERLYNICHKYPRHKQMAMKAKPHNTWILTHASQSRIRPW